MKCIFNLVNGQREVPLQSLKTYDIYDINGNAKHEAFSISDDVVFTVQM